MHDIVVLSDLHIGRGRNPATGRYHSLETFFFDDDLRRFLKHQAAESKARGVPLRVVFNGDTFDFLRTEPSSDPGASRREQRFGADLSPERAAELVTQSLEGHPGLVAAFADVVEAGNEVVMLPGNHDLEVQFEAVQSCIRAAVRVQLQARGVATVDEAVARFRFAPWFHHEPGRIWIEHGCQYDPECAFRFPLRASLGAAQVDPKLFELDLPLGNFFQRYLYNAFGPLTFIVPSTRANSRYARWLLIHEPRLLLRVVASHVPFIFQVLRRLARGGTAHRKPLEKAHVDELDRLASESGLGLTLKAIDAMKMVRGDLTQAASQYSLSLLRFLVVVFGVGLVGASVWFSAFQAIQEVEGFGLKALLFVALNFLMMGGALGAAVWTLVRQPPDSAPAPLRRGAARICRLVDVPIVTFGHTHDEVVWALERGSGGKGWYYNTGTWIAVFTHDVLLPRERVQYTFLRVRGLDAELLQWSPGRGEALPVVLLDEAPGDTGTALLPAAEVG